MAKIDVDRRDRLRIALRDVRKDMQGINPKLSIYKDLQKREAELILELENNYT